MNEISYILLVEDNPDIRSLMRQFVIELPYTVVEAASAHQAATILDSGQKFDLAIVDFWLDSSSAVPLLDQINGKSEDMPIILVSGGGEGIDLEMTQAIGDVSGAVSFLQKPFTKASFLAAINQALKPKI